jgi:hypothetical protein
LFVFLDFGGEFDENINDFAGVPNLSEVENHEDGAETFDPGKFSETVEDLWFEGNMLFCEDIDEVGVGGGEEWL